MNNLLHLVGIAKKAGRLEVGEEPVGSAARSKQAKLILVASDAAENSARRASHFAETGKIPWMLTPFTKAELGMAVGRGACAMMALTDAGFASALAEKLAAEDPTYAAAAAELALRAAKALERQKEQRVHERRVREAKQRPWAAPPTKDMGRADRKVQTKTAAVAATKRPTPRGVITIKKRMP